MRILHLLATLLIATATHACINMTERISGVKMEDVEFYNIGSVEVDKDSVLAFIRRNGEGCGAGINKNCNDLVIARLFMRQFAAALDLSTKLVARHPKDYGIVITHAAALELNGKIREAIPFMEQAIALNPKSHKGSEWIHLNLLKQRLNGEAAISPWALIGYDLRPDSLPTKPDSVVLRALVKQVHYQVNDRIFFTPKNDPLFGALVFAYADLLYLNGYRNQAKREYERAASYGFTYKHSTPVLELVEAPPAAPVAEVKAALPPPPQEKSRTAEWLAGIFIGAIMIAVVAFIWKNSRMDR